MIEWKFEKENVHGEKVIMNLRVWKVYINLWKISNYCFQIYVINNGESEKEIKKKRKGTNKFYQPIWKNLRRFKIIWMIER